jgi:hypothetical protein
VVLLKKKDGEPSAIAEEPRVEFPIAPDEGEAPEPVEPVDSEY